MVKPSFEEFEEVWKSKPKKKQSKKKRRKVEEEEEHDERGGRREKVRHKKQTGIGNEN